MTKLILICLLLTASVAWGQDTFDGCKPTGDATNAKAMNLDVLKNRWTAPTEYDTMTLDQFAALTKMSIHQLRGGVITGYVMGVKASGAEACNCHKKDAKHTDTHITIVGDPAHTEGKERYIVEVTPRNRVNHRDWASAMLKKSILHHWVEFSGWQMWDWEHENAAENTHPHGKNNWRKTPAELHSLFSIKVVK